MNSTSRQGTWCSSCKQAVVIAATATWLIPAPHCVCNNHHVHM
jgi:hypothetical protein